MTRLRASRLASWAALASVVLAVQPVYYPLSGEQVPLTGVDSETSAVKKPMVETEALQSFIKKENLLARAEDLYTIANLSAEEYNHPTRVIGSAGHNGTLRYIWKTIAELGDYYTLNRQAFVAVVYNIFESRLVLGQDVPASAIPMSPTPPTKNREPVHGDVILVKEDGCESSHYPDTVRGNIAFIRRGRCSFSDKSKLAGRAGAITAVIYNYEDSDLGGTLGEPHKDHVPTFGLAGTDADAVLKKLGKGERVDGIAYIDAELEEITTHNIIAQTTAGDPNNCVMLGGHTDSVTEGPGINDDGSGSMSLLEVAKQLTRFTVNNCVRFGWFSGEEEGLLGSGHYVKALSATERHKIRVFMDYDMMGSPNFAYQIYNATNDVNPPGSQELRDLYVEWYKAHGLNYTFIPFDGRSDYDAFIRNSIPGGGIATGAEDTKTKEEERVFGGKAGEWYDPCYHQLCDDAGNVNLTAWEVNTKLIAHTVATFALSFDGFPERTSSVKSTKQEKPFKFHGHQLIM